MYRNLNMYVFEKVNKKLFQSINLFINLVQSSSIKALLRKFVRLYDLSLTPHATSINYVQYFISCQFFAALASTAMKSHISTIAWTVGGSGL